jgi:hypothetical protein
MGHLFTTPVLLLVLLAACSPVPLSPLDECGGACPAGSVCGAESGQCESFPEVGRGVADLAPGFDTAWVGNVAAAAGYDRLNKRILYGLLDPNTDAQFQWTTVLSDAGALAGEDPPMALVGSASGPVLFLGRPDGSLMRGKPQEPGWQWEELANLQHGLTFMDALLVPDVGYHVVVTTDALETLFLEQVGGTISAPESVSGEADERLVQPPMSLVRLAGRTTLLGYGLEAGLVSLSRESSGWIHHLLVPDVTVGAVALMQTPLGVLTVYLDGDDGGLYQVIEDELGTVSAVELAAGVRSPATMGLPVRIALGVSADGAFALYHDVLDQEVRLLRSEPGWQWRQEASRYQSTPLLPALVSIPDYAPLPLGLDLGVDGYGPGKLKVLF